MLFLIMCALITYAVFMIVLAAISRQPSQSVDDIQDDVSILDYSTSKHGHGILHARYWLLDILNTLSFADAPGTWGGTVVEAAEGEEDAFTKPFEWAEKSSVKCV